MTELHALWLPIVLSAVIVFVVSSVIHMFTPWHKGDYSKIPNEDRVMDALRPLNIPPVRRGRGSPGRASTRAHQAASATASLPKTQGT